MKACTKCRNYLPLEMFYRDNSRIDGHKEQCKDCSAERYLGKDARFINNLLQNWGRA